MLGRTIDGYLEITQYQHEILLKNIIPYSPCSVHNSVKTEQGYQCQKHDTSCPVIQQKIGVDYCNFESMIDEIQRTIKSGNFVRVVVARYKIPER